MKYKLNLLLEDVNLLKWYSSHYNKFILLEFIPVAEVYILAMHGQVVNLYL